MDLTQAGSIAGTIGGICSIGAFFPQAYRILQRRSASDISLLMYVTIIVGCALWMFYAYVFGLPALFWTNVAITAIALVIVGLRLRYGRESKASG